MILLLLLLAVLHDYDVYTHIDTHLNIKKSSFFRLKTQFHFVPTCNNGKKFHNNRKKGCNFVPPRHILCFNYKGMFSIVKVVDDC